MKLLFRLFFKTVRLILGPFILLWERLTRPRAISRTSADQARIDQESQELVLYQFKTCPFCIKVRQEMHRLSLNIEKRDAQKPGIHRQELLAQGGQVKVPCLRIRAEGHDSWLYESEQIIDYLRRRFPSDTEHMTQTES